MEAEQAVKKLSTKKELWAPIKDSEFDMISSWGNQKRLGYNIITPKGIKEIRERVFRPTTNGHLGVVQPMCHYTDTKGKKRKQPVCKIVAEAFLGPCPPDKKLKVLDGDVMNTHINNLEYVIPYSISKKARKAIIRMSKKDKLSQDIAVFDVVPKLSPDSTAEEIKQYRRHNEQIKPITPKNRQEIINTYEAQIWEGYSVEKNTMSLNMGKAIIKRLGKNVSFFSMPGLGRELWCLNTLLHLNYNQSLGVEYNFMKFQRLQILVDQFFKGMSIKLNSIQAEISLAANDNKYFDVLHIDLMQILTSSYVEAFNKALTISKLAFITYAPAARMGNSVELVLDGNPKPVFEYKFKGSTEEPMVTYGFIGR